MAKLILLCAINLARYLTCSIFEGWLAPWTTNICLDRLDFFWEVLATVVALFWQTGQGDKWQVIWCLRRHKIIHDVGSCLSLQYGCLTSSWWKETWSRSCRGRRQETKVTKGNLTITPFSTTRLSCISSASLFFPPSPPHHCHPSSSPPHPSPSPSEELEGIQALPPLLQGPIRQALGFLHRDRASSSPQASK